jgi:hypothetical protein
MKNYIQGLFILIGIVTTLVSTIEEAYSQTSGLIGKFDGRNVQEARIRQVGELTVAVEINGQQWFASRRGETNFSQIRGCTVGDFNGRRSVHDYWRSRALLLRTSRSAPSRPWPVAPTPMCVSRPASRWATSSNH